MAARDRRCPSGSRASSSRVVLPPRRARRCQRRVAGAVELDISLPDASCRRWPPPPSAEGRVRRRLVHPRRLVPLRLAIIRKTTASHHDGEPALLVPLSRRPPPTSSSSNERSSSCSSVSSSAPSRRSKSAREEPDHAARVWVISRYAFHFTWWHDGALNQITLPVPHPSTCLLPSTAGCSVAANSTRRGPHELCARRRSPSPRSCIAKKLSQEVSACARAKHQQSAAKATTTLARAKRQFVLVDSRGSRRCHLCAECKCRH